MNIDMEGLILNIIHPCSLTGDAVGTLDIVHGHHSNPENHQQQICLSYLPHGPGLFFLKQTVVVQNYSQFSQPCMFSIVVIEIYLLSM